MDCKAIHYVLCTKWLLMDHVNNNADNFRKEPELHHYYAKFSGHVIPKQPFGTKNVMDCKAIHYVLCIKWLLRDHAKNTILLISY